ncbi:MAG TPA: hypothetical protein DCS88_10800 [Alphaproteobacteria bacterium]|nr:hypothetical protein [Alphaproteobacteria bacterium]
MADDPGLPHPSLFWAFLQGGILFFHFQGVQAFKKKIWGLHQLLTNSISRSLVVMPQILQLPG